MTETPESNQLMPIPTKQKNFRLPWPLASRLEEAARKTGKNQEDIVISALREYLNSFEDGSEKHGD